MTENKYQFGKIYKLMSEHTNKIYIGSTCKKRLSTRLSNHMADYKGWKNEKRKYITSFELFELGIVHILLLETYPCNNRSELDARERHWIEHHRDILVNKNIPTRTDEEYNEDNKYKIKEIKKKYRDNNKDKLNQQKKEYYEDNKEIIAEKHKQYYEVNKEMIKQKREVNKDKINEFKKQYYEANKEIIKQYYESNKDKIREQKRQYYEANKDKINERKRIRDKEKRDKKCLIKTI
jgi:hypothetical protein